MSAWDHNRTLRGAWNPQLAVVLRVAELSDSELPLVGDLRWSDAALGWVATWSLKARGHRHRWSISGVNYEEAFRNPVRGAARVLSGNGEPLWRASKYARPSLERRRPRETDHARCRLAWHLSRILRLLDRMEKWPPSSRAAIVSKFSPHRLPAAGLRTQRQSLAPPVTEEPSLADPHSGMSRARSGRREIPVHRDGPRPCLC
jgi:hypothetical protein